MIYRFVIKRLEVPTDYIFIKLNNFNNSVNLVCYLCIFLLICIVIILGLSLIYTSDLSSQTPDRLSFSTPRKLKLRTELKEAKEKIRNLEKNVKPLSTVLIENDSTDIFLKVSKIFIFYIIFM